MDSQITGHGAGAYSNRIQVQQNTPTKDAAGQGIANWNVDNPFARRWAQIVPRGGSEKRIFEQLQAHINYLVRLRSDSLTRQVLPADFRFQLADGTILNIESRIDVDSRRMELEFRCIENVSR
jgi:SPP1 family predicted phage head-tail adaptor